MRGDTPAPAAAAVEYNTAVVEGAADAVGVDDEGKVANT